MQGAFLMIPLSILDLPCSSGSHVWLAMAFAREVLHVVYAAVARGGVDFSPVEKAPGMLGGAGNDMAAGEKGRSVEGAAKTHAVYRRTPPLAWSPETGRHFAMHGRSPARAAVHGPTPVPDEHGLEHVLVHFALLTGTVIKSGIFKEHDRLLYLQLTLNLECAVLLKPGERFQLVLQLGSASRQATSLVGVADTLSALCGPCGADDRQTFVILIKIDEVELWDRQYDEVKGRYKFLVLDGKRSTSKSRFTANRTLPENFLNVDCSSATELDLRSFDLAKHRVVLFHEASPELELRGTNIAHASMDELSLGQSSAIMNSYLVWFHRVKLIVASNVWVTSTRRLTAEDQEWLAVNSAYVWVGGPFRE